MTKKEAIEQNIHRFKEIANGVHVDEATECGLCEWADEKSKNTFLHPCEKCFFPKSVGTHFDERCVSAYIDGMRWGRAEEHMKKYALKCVAFYEQWHTTGKMPKVEYREE